MSAVGTGRRRSLAALMRFIDWVDDRRWLALLLIGITIVGAVANLWRTWELTDGATRLGIDYRQYIGATQRYLAGGSFYLPLQLTGPYAIPPELMTDVSTIPVLYPPLALALLIPATVLPAVLWWVLPLGFLIWHIAACRPHWVACVLIAILLSYQNSTWLIVSGNPAMWTAAALAAGLRWHWPTPFVLLKPTLAPFAIVGIRHRGWWVTAAGLVVVSLLVVPLWMDYVTAVLNAQRGRVGPLYSLSDVPLMLIPIVAWAARRGSVAGASAPAAGLAA